MNRARTRSPAGVMSHKIKPINDTERPHDRRLAGLAPPNLDPVGGAE